MSDILHRLISIEHKTNSMQDSLGWLVAANAPELKNALVKSFKANKSRIRIYLALDGTRNVNEIAKILNMLPNNVSREISWLKNKRLLDEVERDGTGILYKKKAFDGIVGLSEQLMQDHSLDSQGRPAAKKK